MSKRSAPEHQPFPDDLRPVGGDLETTNEEFLSDLGAKLDAPPTWQERKATYESYRDKERLMQDSRTAGAESTDVTLDKLDLTMEQIVGQEQWAKLDSDTLALHQIARDIYQQIGGLIRAHQNEAPYRLLESEARAHREKLAQAETTFRQGDMDIRAFMQAVNRAVADLDTVKAKISKVSST